MDETPVSLLERLATNAQSQDWEQLSAVYRPLLFGWLRPLVPQESDVEDLIQETMIVVMAKISQFKHGGTQGAFRAWLRSIVVNKVRTFWRAHGKIPKANDPACVMLAELEHDESSLSNVWDAQHDRHVLETLLATIRPEFQPQTWLAFERYTLQGVEAAVVAKELGVSVNVVFIARSRVMRRLRAETQGLVNFDELLEG